jgi:hypothetical protein
MSAILLQCCQKQEKKQAKIGKKEIPGLAQFCEIKRKSRQDIFSIQVFVERF